MANSGKYYAYINKAIRGPLSAKELAKLHGFDHNSLVCTEEHFGHWMDVSTIEEFSFIFDPSFYDVSAETAENKDPIEDAEQVSHTESEDANAYKAVLEKAIVVNGDLEKEIKKLKQQYEEDKVSFANILKKRDSIIHELQEKLKHAPKPESPTWEGLYKAAKQRNDELTGEFTKKLNDKEDEIKFLTEVVKKNEQAVNEQKEKREKEFKEESEKTQFLLEQKETELKTAVDNLDIKEKELQNAIDKINEQGKHFQELKEQKEKTETSISEQQNEISVLKEKIAKTESGLQKLEEIQKDNSELKLAIEEKKKENEDLEQALEAAKKDVQETTDSFAKVKSDFDSEIKKLNDKYDNSVKNAEETKKSLKEKEELIKNLQTKLSGEDNKSSRETESLRQELQARDTTISNLRADLSEATRRVQETSANEEMNIRKREEFYDTVNKKINSLADYIKELEEQLKSNH